MVIVDSSVRIDFLTDQPSAQAEWLQRAIGYREIALTDLILCEVLQDVSSDRQFEQVNAALQRFDIFDLSGVQLAVAAAANHRFLRGRGITVRSTIDCLIATFCMENGHALLHHDRDYEAFERFLGLQVIQPVDA